MAGSGRRRNKEPLTLKSGAIVYLASLAAWVTISEECGLSSDDARQGVAWAIDILVTELSRENVEHRHQFIGGKYDPGQLSDSRHY